MALWMKKEDGTLVDVSGGGGGTFDGEHVPTGDPTDPATLDIVDEGQLLFDGVESDGSDGGPHNHAEYAPVEHDHDEFTHDHAEYALQTELADETAARIAGDSLEPYTVTQGTAGEWPGVAHLGKLGPLPIWQLSVTLFSSNVTYAQNDDVITGFPAEALPNTPGTSLKFTLYDYVQDKQLPMYIGLAADGSVAVKAGVGFTVRDIRGAMTWIAPDRSTFSAGDFRAMVDDWRSEARIETLKGN